MAERGMEGVAINEITEAADVGFGSFYNHFESKEAIYAVLGTACLRILRSPRSRGTRDHRSCGIVAASVRTRCYARAESRCGAVSAPPKACRSVTGTAWTAPVTPISRKAWSRSLLGARSTDELPGRRRHGARGGSPQTCVHVRSGLRRSGTTRACAGSRTLARAHGRAAATHTGLPAATAQRISAWHCPASRTQLTHRCRWPLPQAVAQKKPAQPEPVIVEANRIRAFRQQPCPASGARCEANQGLLDVFESKRVKGGGRSAPSQLVLRADRVAPGFTLTKAQR